jgi:putative acetyltransferase
VRCLLETHLPFSHEVTPVGQVHALEVDALRDDAVTPVSARDDGRLLGVGALKETAPA